MPSAAITTTSAPVRVAERTVALTVTATAASAAATPTVPPAPSPQSPTPTALPPTATPVPPSPTPRPPPSAVAPAADGKAIFTLRDGALARGIGADETIVARGVQAPNLAALDAMHLVSGAMTLCARGGGGAPLRYSQNGGATWQAASGPGAQAIEGTPALVRGTDVFALTCGGILWSTDSGRTYKRVANLSPANYDPQAVALSSDGRFAYLAATSEGGSLVVVRSERLGSGWDDPHTVAKGWGKAALGVSPENQIYLGTATGVQASSDRGQTWQSVSAGLEAELLSTDPSQGRLTDADTARLRAGVGVYAFAFLDKLVVAATNHGIYTRRVGEPWQRRPEIASAATRLAVAGSSLFVTTPRGVVTVTLG